MATYRIDKESRSPAHSYAANNSVTGTSLITGFLPPGFPVATETIAMKEYLLGIAYSRKF
jgi:hypothetical protein